jgi:hypothetical protein
MAVAYTKLFLMDAFLSRYADVLVKDTSEEVAKYTKMCSDFYDKVGKDKFRVWASLDADAIKVFKASKK